MCNGSTTPGYSTIPNGNSGNELNRDTSSAYGVCQHCDLIAPDDFRRRSGPPQSSADDGVQRDLDVPASGVGIGADLVCGFHQLLGDDLVDAGQFDMQCHAWLTT